MTAPTQPCCTPVAALAGTPSEALSQVLVILGMVLCGTATHAEDTVIRTSEDGIPPQWASAKRPAAAIFKVVVTCLFGVTGVAVTEL